MNPSTRKQLALRHRPPGRPLMHQIWQHLLFMHWPVPLSRLRGLVPAELELDTFEGQAWVGMTPFTIHGMRPHGLPAVPLLSKSHELNLRTYVTAHGRPGIWFLSLDAANPLAVWFARLGFGLPYFHAHMELQTGADSARLTSRRKARHDGAMFDATWTLGRRLPEAAPGTLEFFLIERYCLFAKRRGRLISVRIHHRPWSLQEASLLSFHATLFESAGLPMPAAEPLLHAQGETLPVQIWAPTGIDRHPPAAVTNAAWADWPPARDLCTAE
jgi:uncharacterized protein